MRFIANREFDLDKYSNPELCALPTAEELRTALIATEGADVRSQLAGLFDDNTFIETGVYTKRAFSDYFTTDKANEFEGVLCGYGAIDGKLTYVFAEDASRMGGAIDERHAKKIEDIYALALRNGAPVIGIFNSNGADVFTGASSLAAYARIMKCVSRASGIVPQIAFVSGKCIGTAAAIASMFDFVVKAEGAQLYVADSASKNAQDSVITYVGEVSQCLGYIRALVSFLPENAEVGAEVGECADNLNRMLGELDFGGNALSMVSTLADNGVFYEIGKSEDSPIALALTTIGGVRCGVVASAFAVNEGRISKDAARRAAKFVTFCDLFTIPVVTLVDSFGLATDKENEVGYAEALSDLAFAYASSDSAKVTVIVGHAIGAAFPLLGSKALGADVVYAVDNSEIGALPSECGVAFAWDKYITLEKTREELVNEWKMNVSSPVAAASTGEVDDIISVNELRARICSALLMLSAKGKYNKVLPL